jgi:hypothetical protein
MTCPECGKTAVTQRGLNVHIGHAHKGPKATVKSETAKRAPADLVARGYAEPGSTVLIHGEEVQARVFPPKEDRHNAEVLAGLPWLRYPATVGECDEALDLLAISIERARYAMPFMLSLRAIVTELRKRLIAQKEAA